MWKTLRVNDLLEVAQRMSDSKKTNPVTFGYYCVALIDILGQQEALQRFKEIPRTDDERNDFIQIAKKTFGVVDGIRNMFDSFYSGYNTPPPADEMLKTDLKFQGFSDTIIIYVPLASISERIPINSIYAGLLACGSTLLYSMAAGHPLRGGIEIGIAAELYEGEIYGPALSEAYRLESQVAQYPRIVVGRELTSYLWAYKNSSELDVRAKFIKGMAECCLGLLTQDVDGQPIVDYLGEGFMTKVDCRPLDDDIVNKAYQFVTDEAKKWREQRNTQLAFRYALLHNYFVERIALWKDRLK